MIGSWLICIDRSFVNLSVLFYELSFYEVVLEILGWVVGFGVGGGVVHVLKQGFPRGFKSAGKSFFSEPKVGGNFSKKFSDPGPRQL